MLRRILRFPSLLLLSALHLPVALGSRLLEACGAGDAALRFAAAVQRSWARSLLAVLGLELDLRGTPPAGACVIVANHLSYLDIPVLAAFFPGRFVAKSEIASWPVLGQMARTVGTIFVVQRKQRDVLRVEREMKRTLAAGVPVLLFPEGRSTRGATVERFKSALLEAAAAGDVPCLAVSLSYETPEDPWTPAATVCWWGGMGFWRHAWTLTGLRRIRAHVRVGAGPRHDRDRKALTASLHADVLAGFDPHPEGPLPPDYPWPELFPASAPAGMVSSGVPE